MDIKKITPETRKEIALVALTYRTSSNTLAKVLNATPEEINELLRTEFDLAIPLYSLKIETECEDEIDEKASYVYAYNYFIERSRIRRKLREASKANDEEKVTQLRSEMKEHFKKVDDTIAMGAIGRSLDTLTPREREAISRYRLKYGLSKKTCSEIFKCSRDAIAKFEKELSERDLIFKGKIESLNGFWDKNHWKYIQSEAKKTGEAYEENRFDPEIESNVKRSK